MIFEGETPSFLKFFYALKRPLAEFLDRFLQPIAAPPLLAEEYADADDAQRQQKSSRISTAAAPLPSRRCSKATRSCVALAGPPSVIMKISAKSLTIQMVAKRKTTPITLLELS